MLRQVKAVDPSLLGQSNDPCSLLSLNVLQTVPQCMTKYNVVVQLWFDRGVVNAGNYNSDYKAPTEKSLLTYTAAQSVTTVPVVARRDVAYFKVQATLVVRGENVAQALTERLKNTSSVLAGLGLPGLLTVSRPYYCVEGGTCAVALVTTPPPAVSGGGGGDGGGGEGGGGGGAGGAQWTNATNSSWGDAFVATTAAFEPLSSLEPPPTTTAAAAADDNSTAGETSTAAAARRLLSAEGRAERPRRRVVSAADDSEFPRMRRRPQPGPSVGIA
jgi:hypothetical protein